MPIHAPPRLALAALLGAAAGVELDQWRWSRLEVAAAAAAAAAAGSSPDVSRTRRRPGRGSLMRAEAAAPVATARPWGAGSLLSLGLWPSDDAELVPALHGPHGGPLRWQLGEPIHDGQLGDGAHTGAAPASSPPAAPSAGAHPEAAAAGASPYAAAGAPHEPAAAHSTSAGVPEAVQPYAPPEGHGTEHISASKDHPVVDPIAKDMVMAAQNYDEAGYPKKGTAMVTDPDAAWILFSVLIVTVLVFYAVNSEVHALKTATWETVAQVISIFLALLISDVFKAASDLAASKISPPTNAGADYSLSELQSGAGMASMLTGALGGPGPKPSLAMLALDGCRATLFFFLLEFMLWAVRHNPSRLTAVGLLGAHITGFMYAEAFGVMQEIPPFKKSAGLVFSVVVIAVVTLLAGTMIAYWARRFALNRRTNSEEAERWEHQCMHSENEFIAFCVGLLITQFWRKVITGVVPSFHGVQKNGSPSEVLSMFVVALGTAAVMIFVAKMKPAAQERGERTFRTICLVAEVFAMAAAWSFLFWGKWQFWLAAGVTKITVQDVLHAVLCQAVLFNFVAFAFILFFYRLQLQFGTKFDDMLLMLNSVIALAWEGVCIVIIYETVKVFKAGPVMTVVYKALFAMVLCALLLPAWMWYILPLSHAGQQMHGGGHGHGHVEGLGHSQDKAAKADSAGTPSDQGEAEVGANASRSTRSGRREASRSRRRDDSSADAEAPAAPEAVYTPPPVGDHAVYAA